MRNPVSLFELSFHCSDALLDEAAEPVRFVGAAGAVVVGGGVEVPFGYSHRAAT
jgi:hypothetical protein